MCGELSKKGMASARVGKLWTDTKSRRRYEDLADFYAILKATEHLERAFTSSAISQEDYTRECQKLIGQFRVSEKALITAGSISSTVYVDRKFP